MTEAPQQDHTGLIASLAAFFTAAGAFLLRKLGKQPRPDIPKGLSVADFRRITEHVDARSDARLAEALRPFMDRLDSICCDLAEGRGEMAGMKFRLDNLSQRTSSHDGIIQVLQQRISSTGGD